MNKTCCMCKRHLPRIAFKANKGRADGLQSQCIECHKAYRRKHYLANKSKYLGKAKLRKKAMIQWWKGYKATLKCERCPENHPACLQFHHPDDNKEADVCKLVYLGSIEKLVVEVQKCQVLCANCHAKLHWREAESSPVLVDFGSRKASILALLADWI